MDWREFNKAAFEKKYKVFVFITKKEDTNFLSDKVCTKFDNCFANVLEKSQETPTILSMQISSEKKGFLPFGNMVYNEKNLKKCVEKYKNHKNWKVYNTQIWAGNRKKILEENKFPEFVFTNDYVGVRYENHPIDNVFACSFENDFYNNHKIHIESAIKELKNQIIYKKGFYYTRTWFVGFLSPEGVAGISSIIAGVDGVLTSINLIDLETLEWNNKQCDLKEVVEI